jgi:PAS domain S-box-containing protein
MLVIPLSCQVKQVSRHNIYFPIAARFPALFTGRPYINLIYYIRKNQKLRYTGRELQAQFSASPKVACGMSLDQLEITATEFFRLNPNPMWIFDPATLRFLDVNEAAILKYGYSRDEFLAMTITDIRPEEDIRPDGDTARLIETVRARTSLISDAGIWKHQVKDGSIRYMQITSSRVFQETGEVRMVHALDVTALVQTEDSLRAANTRYALAARATQTVVWDVEVTSETAFWSDSLYDLFGYDLENNATDLHWWAERIFPGDRERVVASFARFLDSGAEIWKEEYRFQKADGNYVTVEDTGYAVRDADGKLLRAIGAMADVTERRRTEEQLRQNQHEYTRKMTLLAEAALAIHTPRSEEGILKAITEQARQIIGAHQAVTSLIREKWESSLHNISMSEKYAAWETYDAPLTGQGIYSEICRTNRPLRLTQEELTAHPAWGGFGSDAAFHPPMRGWLAVPLMYRDGRNLGVLHLSDKYEGDFTAEDESILIQLAQLASLAIENQQLLTTAEREIRERSRTESALRLSETRLANAQRIARLGNWELQLKNETLWWSDEVYSLFGVAKDDFPLTLKAFYERVHPNDRPLLWEARQQAVNTSGFLHIEHRIVLPDGSVRYVLEIAELYYDEDGNPDHLSGTVQDITERKETEQEIRRANELLEQRVRERTHQLEESNALLQIVNQELESFSYSVSHDLRAPLRAVDGFSQALLEDYSSVLDDTAQGYLTLIRQGSQRMSELIDDLLSLARVTRQELYIVPVDLSALVGEVVESLSKHHNRHRVPVTIASNMTANGDARLLRILLETLSPVSATAPTERVSGNRYRLGDGAAYRLAARRLCLGGSGRGRRRNVLLYTERGRIGLAVMLKTVRA